MPSRVDLWEIAVFRKTGGYHGLPMFELGTLVGVLEPPRGHIYADPFLVSYQGRIYLLFEDFSFITNRGLISGCEMRSDGTPGSVEVILESSEHLSYPHVFEHGGNLYMIPETRTTSSVQLLRCEGALDRWVHHATILRNMPAVDSTLHHDGDLYWLFTCLLDGARKTGTGGLHVYYADALEGPWMAHRRNPIPDVQPDLARPAGRVWGTNEHVYRLAQDCTQDYGHSISIREVTQLTPDSYSEVERSRLEPTSLRGINNVRRTHCFDQLDGLQAIDFMRPGKWEIGARVWRRLRRRLLPQTPTEYRRGARRSTAFSGGEQGAGGTLSQRTD